MGNSETDKEGKNMENGQEDKLAGIPAEIRDFSFNMGTIRRYKQARGKGVEEAIPGDPEDLLTLIWAGIAKKHPKMTIDDVAELIDLSNIGQIDAFVGQVCLRSRIPLGDDPN